MDLRIPSSAVAYVGRESERAALEALLNGIAGGGAVALLAGEPGIGKTRTAEELVFAATERSIQVLWGRCFEGEGAPPFWPWMQIVRSYAAGADAGRLIGELGDAGSVIAQLVPELRASLGALAPPPHLDPQQARFRLFDSLTRLFFAVARIRPLLLVLDDLHWADSASLHQLQFMARDLHSVPLIVLGTYRHAEAVRGRPLAQALADLARSPGTTRIQLRGLSEASVAQIVEAESGRRPPPGLAAAVTVQTEGNPFFVTEIVRLLGANGWIDSWIAASAGGARLAIPHSVRETIGRRLDLLSQGCMTILTMAAVLGREFELRTLEAMAAAQRDAPADEDAVLDALEEAEEREIVAATPANPGWYRFGHALIREVLYDELPSTRRMRLHRLAGETLERLHGNGAGQLAEIASHFVRAAPARDAAKAIRYERWAGEQALSIFAYEEAARHFASALHVLDLAGGAADLSGEDSRQSRCDLLLALGGSLRMAGKAAEADDAFLRALELARQLEHAPRFTRAVQGIAGDIPQRRGIDPLVSGLLSEALARAGEEDSHERAMLLTRLATERYYLLAVDESRALGEEAAALALRAGDVRARAYALRFLALSDAVEPEQRVARSDELIRLAKAEQNPVQELAGHGWRAIGLMQLGDAAGAEDAIAAYTALAARLHHPVHLAQVAMLQAMRAAMIGRFAEAESLAEQVRASAQGAGRADALSATTGVYSVLRALQGRLGELEESIQGFIAREPAATPWRCALAYLYAETGRPAEARELFEALAEAGFASIPRDNLLLLALTALAECCAFLADGDRAGQLYTLLQPYTAQNVVISGGTGCGGSVARCLGLLATTLQRWEDAERHFDAALAMNARIGAVPWLAITQFNYAAMLHARAAAGDRERARTLVAEACATADQLGMATLARRGAALRAAMDAGGEREPALSTGRRRHPDGLSEREVGVLRLLASGLSNKEIAESLVLSPRTVETHLNRAYAKIGARGRSDAIAYVFRSGLN